MRRTAVAVLVTAVVAGCGGSTRAPTPAGGEATIAFIKRAALATVVQPTEVTISVTGDKGGSAASGAGVVDFHRPLGGVDLIVKDLGAVKLIVAGEYLYLNVAKFRSVLGSRPWFKLTYTQLGSLGRVYGLGTLCSTSAADPTQGVDWLAGATGAVTRGGTRQIRDATTTEYTLTIDPAAAGAAAPRGSNMARVTTLLDGTKFPVALWIDAEGRVRLVNYTIALPETPNGPDAGRRPVTMSVEYFGFGAAVTAAEPPPDQVRDFTELQKYLGGGTNSVSG